MNSDIWKGKTKEMRGQLKSWWGKLTDNDLTRIEGDAEVLAGTLQERYGWTKDQVKKEMNKRLSQFNKRSGKYSSASNYSKKSKVTPAIPIIDEDLDGPMGQKLPNTQNLEDPYKEAEYEAAEGDLTERLQRPRKFKSPYSFDDNFQARAETEDV